MDIRNLLNEPLNTGKPFSCVWNDCSKSFSRRSDLSRHKRIHTGERPYHCKWADCGKQFIQRSALTVHYRTHTGERPHSCEYFLCGKSFSDSSSLARHRRTHTGKRPYVCHFTDCGKSFTRKTTLSRHQRCHDPKWKPFNINKALIIQQSPPASPSISSCESEIDTPLNSPSDYFNPQSKECVVFEQPRIQIAPESVKFIQYTAASNDMCNYKHLASNLHTSVTTINSYYHY